MSMSQQQLWSDLDAYLAPLFAPSDSALEAVLQSSRDADLPTINVSPLQGKFLHFLAKTIGARRILEIGTLAGYSTIWLARALPAEGTLVTLEANPTHAEIARTNIARAGLGSVVSIRLGRAADSLAQLVAEKTSPFDLIFIDADKPGIPDYFEASLKLARPGTLIIVDNVIRKGTILDLSSPNPDAQAIRRFNQTVATHPRVTATTLQTVGQKGHDGMTLLLVNS
jgi:predicted O-methyltransferase YrrM